MRKQREFELSKAYKSDNLAASQRAKRGLESANSSLNFAPII